MCNKADAEDLHNAMELLCEFEPLDKRPVHEALDENGVVWMFQGDDAIGIRAFIESHDEGLPVVAIDGSGIFGRDYAMERQ